MMQTRQHNLSPIYDRRDGYGGNSYDFHQPSYQARSYQNGGGRHSRPLSNYESGDRYSLSELDRLASWKERLSSDRDQAEYALRNAQAASLGRARRDSFSSRQPYWTCPCGNSGYDHQHHDHLSSASLYGDMNALGLGTRLSRSTSLGTPPTSFSEFGSRYPRGRYQSGYSLGEALPRSTFRKAEQLERCRLALQAAYSSGSQYHPSQSYGMGSHGSDYRYNDYPAYGSGNAYMNRGMGGGLRRSASTPALAGYGYAY